VAGILPTFDAGLDTLETLTDQAVSEVYNKKGGCPWPALPDVSGNSDLIDVIDPIWHDIAVRATQPGRPSAISQAEMNADLARAVTLTHAEAAYIWQRTLLAIVTQAATEVGDIESVRSQISRTAASLQGQISSLQRGLGVSSATAVEQAVAISEAHSDALTSRVATALGTQIADLNASLHHVAAEVAAGDTAAVRSANAHTDVAVAAEAHSRDVAVAGLAVTMRSDVLNLGAKIDSVATTVEAQVASGIQTAEGFASTVASQAEAGAVAQALTQVQPQIDSLKNETDQCLEPLCDTVTPNARQLGKLGSLLKAFEGLGLAAVLAALVVEAIADPAAAASQIETAGGWTTDLATELVSAVVG
jgi:hypothetical protein